MLFNKLPTPDRSRTQLAYMLYYYPVDQMPANTVDTFVAWRKRRMIPKYKLLDMCNEELTTLQLPGNATQFTIHWAFNNIPTQLEWERKGGGYLIDCELRISPVTGPIAVLSFGTVKHMNPFLAS